MKRFAVLAIVMVAIGCLWMTGCASTPVSVASAQPTTVQAVPTRTAWGPAPTREEAENWSQVNQTVTIAGESQRAAVLQSIVGSYWGVSKFNIQPGTGHEVVVTGAGGTQTVPISDKLLANLKKLPSNPQAGDSLTSLCPTQAGLLRQALGPMGAYDKARCPDGDCQSARILKKCLQIGTTSDGIIILVCEAQGKPDGTTAGKWCFAPEHGGWVRQLMIYKQYEPTDAEIATLIPANGRGVWSHLDSIANWDQSQRPSQPKRWDSCKYRSFPPGA